MTQFNVSHTQKPPEPKEVWWFNPIVGIVVAVFVTVVVGMMMAPEKGGETDPVELFSMIVITEVVCFFYLGVGYTFAAQESDRRVDYTGTAVATASAAFIAPWVIASLCYALACLIAFVLVSIFMGALASI